MKEVYDSNYKNHSIEENDNKEVLDVSLLSKERVEEVIKEEEQVVNVFFITGGDISSEVVIGISEVFERDIGNFIYDSSFSFLSFYLSLLSIFFTGKDDEGSILRNDSQNLIKEVSNFIVDSNSSNVSFI